MEFFLHAIFLFNKTYYQNVTNEVLCAQNEELPIQSTSNLSRNKHTDWLLKTFIADVLKSLSATNVRSHLKMWVIQNIISFIKITFLHNVENHSHVHAYVKTYRNTLK